MFVASIHAALAQPDSVRPATLTCGNPSGRAASNRHRPSRAVRRAHAIRCVALSSGTSSAADSAEVRPTASAVRRGSTTPAGLIRPLPSAVTDSLELYLAALEVAQYPHSPPPRYCTLAR